MAPFPAQTVPTREAAEKLELDLRLRRVGGAVAPEHPTTLGQEIDGFLDRLGAAGGLRPRSIEFYEHKAKVWKPLRGVRVSALRRVQVEDFIIGLDGESIQDGGELRRLLRAKRPGDTVRVEIMRGTRRQTVSARLGEV